MKNMTRRRMLMIASSGESRLPTGFKEVQWLRGTGTQYCTTDIYPIYDGRNCTGIRGDFTSLNKEQSTFAIMARWNAGTQHNFGVTTGYFLDVQSQTMKALFIFRYGKSGIENETINLSAEEYPIDLHYELNTSNIKLNEVNQTIYHQIEYTATQKLVIGGYYIDSTTVNVVNNNVLCKSFTIYNNNIALYEFVPCYRKSDGKTGFTQITIADGSMVFLPNEGENEWLIGPRV